MDVTPNGQNLIQVYQVNQNARQNQQQQLLPQDIQPTTLDRRPLTPPSLAAASQPNPLPQYKLPRTTKSIVDLLKIWREGLAGMPSIDSLEARWGARWRPASEKSFFCKRRIIIDEVVRRAAATGQTEHETAKKMDLERGSASLDKIIKILRSRRTGNQATVMTGGSSAEPMAITSS
jgi:hypothetical protein